MKRLITCAVALTLVASLAGCGSPSEDTEEVVIPAETSSIEGTMAAEDILSITVTVPATEEPTSEVTAPTVEATLPEATVPTVEATLPEVTVPTVETTAPGMTVPTVETVPAWEMPTAPSGTVPDHESEVTICNHLFQATGGAAPRCEEAGYQNYLCSKCGTLDQRLLPPLGHSFSGADCLCAQTCSRCGITRGEPLGHLYADGSCSHCGEQDPSVRQITIKIKDNKNAPVPGVSVELYTSDHQPVSTCVSDDHGNVNFILHNHPGKYRLVLTHVPQGYTARQNSFEYQADTGAIVLDLVPVIDPKDHSQASYKVGACMGDFTLTDVDGNIYNLFRLLETKKLVILNFWYCNCVPCKEEFPYFNTMLQRYGDEIQLLALNHFDSEDQIRQLRSEMGLSFPLVSENLGMQQGFDISSYPVTVFIGTDGRILMIQRNAPFESEEALDTIIRQMIGK